MKDYRKGELKSYVIGNILFIITLSGKLDSILKSNLPNNIDIIRLFFESALLSSIIYIYIYIIDSIIPSSIKERIVFLIAKKPGTVVFEYVISKKKGYDDDRFTDEEMKKCYNDIYMEIDKISKRINKVSDKKQKKQIQKELSNYQNSKWFEIYRKHEDEQAVFETQKDYLLNRDMNAITVSILVLYLVVCVSTNLIPFNMAVIVFLSIEFIAISIASNSKAIRFVLTVISRDINKKS